MQGVSKYVIAGLNRPDSTIKIHWDRGPSADQQQGVRISAQAHNVAAQFEELESLP
jgi:hypothetical protein